MGLSIANLGELVKEVRKIGEPYAGLLADWHRTGTVRRPALRPVSSGAWRAGRCPGIRDPTGSTNSTQFWTKDFYLDFPA